MHERDSIPLPDGSGVTLHNLPAELSSGMLGRLSDDEWSDLCTGLLTGRYHFVKDETIIPLDAAELAKYSRKNGHSRNNRGEGGRS